MTAHRTQPNATDAGATTMATIASTSLARSLAMRGWYEATIMFVLLLAGEWVASGPASLATISPHPFWIPVILISVQYGTASGLAIAGLASALSWVAGWPEQASQEDFYSYSMRVWREPILWIFGALIIGSLRDRQIGERAILNESLAALETQRDTLAAFAEGLQGRLTECERLIATSQRDSPAAALESLRDLRRAAPSDATARLEAAASRLLGTASWTYFTFIDRDTSIVSSAGSGGHRDADVVEFLARAAVTHADITGKRLLSVLVDDDSLILNGLGVFASVVRPRDTTSITGLFVIETVAPDRLTPTSAEATLLIAEALADTFDREPTDGEGARRARAKRQRFDLVERPFVPPGAPANGGWLCL